MAKLTKYAASKIINHALGKQEWVFPTGSWLALFTADPGENGILDNELTADGYDRISIPLTMSLSTGGVSSVNTDTLQLGPAAELWPTATHGMIMDAATAGNGLWYAPLTDAVTIDVDQFVEFEPGLLILGVD